LLLNWTPGNFYKFHVLTFLFTLEMLFVNIWWKIERFSKNLQNYIVKIWLLIHASWTLRNASTTLWMFAIVLNSFLVICLSARLISFKETTPSSERCLICGALLSNFKNFNSFGMNILYTLVSLYLGLFLPSTLPITL